MTIREFEQITINSLRNGDTESFCLCYDIYFAPLCSYASRIIRNADESEELVQDLFLEIWQNRSRLPENGSLRAYLFTAVRNDCIDHLKHRKIEKKYADEYLLSAVSHYENIYSDLIDRDIQTQLDSAMNKLPGKCREIFTMSRFSHLSYREIAEKLGISVKTVENQMGNALKTLRKELGHLF
jgi:RNA polymerase sigma-70 factor (ECF subfamily)